jgi:hypothetical protein
MFISIQRLENLRISTFTVVDLNYLAIMGNKVQSIFLRDVHTVSCNYEESQKYSNQQYTLKNLIIQGGRIHVSVLCRLIQVFDGSQKVSMRDTLIVMDESLNNQDWNGVFNRFPLLKSLCRYSHYDTITFTNRS